MLKNKLKRLITYIFADNENFSLEHRLLLSATVIGILLGIFAAVANFFLTTSYIAIYVPLILSVSVLVIYYLVRFKHVIKSVTTPIVVIGILGVAVIWVFNGGINGANIMPAFVVLILGLIIVPEKAKNFILLLFLAVNIFVLLIQLYRPDIIVGYASETDRWIDNLLSLIYSAYFIYLIIRFVHNNYTIERQKAVEHEKKFRILYDNSPDMYLSVSVTDATVLQCNKTLLRNLEYSEEEVIGKSVFNLYDVDNLSEVKATFQQFVETGNIKNKELIIRRKDGSKIDVSLSADAIKDENGKILYSISSWRDISEHKKAESKIIQQNNELLKLNADKDRFMSILAHDLKSPFTSLLGFSDLLLENLHEYSIDKIEEQLKWINEVSHQTFTLLEDLLLWSKSQSGKLPFQLDRIDFQNICSETITSLSFLAEAKKIKINLQMTEKISLIADYNMLKTILRNLISNAIKFTHENGQIKIYANKVADNVTITVSDNGIGIEAENQSKLWNLSQPFTTTGTAEEKGTGLGLLLCKEFVEKHSGIIWVESELGKGSDFKFTIPVSLSTN